MTKILLVQLESISDEQRMEIGAVKGEIAGY